MQDKEIGIRIEVKDGLLTCSIPLLSQENDEVSCKIATYGALKLAEEHASIFYMKRAMQRQQIMRPPVPGSPIINMGPKVH